MKKVIFVRLALAGLLCGGVSFLNTAYADTKSATRIDAYDVDEIVVTAARRDQDAFRSPFTINSQGLATLQETRQIRTIPDAMRELPGVMVQKTGHGQGSPFIRGFTGLRTVFLIDGIRLNNSIFREGPNQYWNTVDPFSVNRLELVKGPSSVLYGSDAIGGTVNSISRSYSDFGWQQGLQKRVLLRGSTAENSLVARPEIGYSNGPLSLFAGVSLKNFGDLKAGNPTGTQPKTGYKEQATDLKFSYALDEKRLLTAAFQFVNQDDAWRSHKTIFGKSWEGTTVGSELRRSLDQRRRLAYLQYYANDLATWLQELSLSVSWHGQDEERDRIRSDGRQDIQGVAVETLGLTGQLVLPSQVGLWTTGIDIYRDEVDSYRRDFNADGSFRGMRIQGPVADNATYDTTAAYIQNQIALNDRMDLLLGLRYTHSAASARAVQDPLTGEQISLSDNWDATVGSVRFSYRPGRNDTINLFAGISQGFRAPNLSDMTRFDSARSNEIETPVSGLDAEKFLTYEIGAKVNRGNWEGQFAAYYTDISDMIIRTPTGRIIDGDNEITKRNSGGGYVNGIELQARYQFSESWSTFGNLTWIDGEVDTFPTSDPTSVREPLDRLMPVTLYLGARWDSPETPYWLEGLVNIVARQDKLSSRDQSDTDRIPAGGTPGYSVLTLRGGWQFSDRFGLSAALENMLDEEYRVHGSGLNEPGRNFVLSFFWRT